MAYGVTEWRAFVFVNLLFPPLNNESNCLCECLRSSECAKIKASVRSKPLSSSATVRQIPSRLGKVP